ncbi:hypothetical protein ACWD5F_13820 [Streptomyces sp. NPDC002499]
MATSAPPVITLLRAALPLACLHGCRGRPLLLEQPVALCGFLVRPAGRRGPVGMLAARVGHLFPSGVRLSRPREHGLVREQPAGELDGLALLAAQVIREGVRIERVRGSGASLDASSMQRQRPAAAAGVGPGGEVT